MRRLAIVALVVALAQPTARAAPDPLEFRPWRDGLLTGLAGGFWILSATLLNDAMSPDACRWCDRNADGSDALNPVDRGVRSALRWHDTGTANTLSNVAAYVVAPLSAFGLGALAAWHDGRTDGLATDAGLVLESVALAAAVNQVTKGIVGRERPFVHVLAPGAKAMTDHPQENNLSFYSGHTSLVFSLAVASGTVASLRHYRLAPLVWGVGLGAAFVTGYLRIAADKHYFTDVTTGAVMGSLVGFGVPYLLGRKSGGPEVAAGLGGGLALINVSGSF